MAINEETKVLDTVVVGAGIAGLTVAYRLRDRDILLLEKEEICGGRTISRKMGEYVYNAGAQVVLGNESAPAKLADELGVKRTLINKTRLSMHMKSKLVAARSEPGFLWGMPLPLMEKVKLAFKLRHINQRYGELADIPLDLNNPKVRELFAKTLEDFVGVRHPDVRALWDAIAMASNTLPSHEVAAFQPINTFLHFAAQEYFVEGGTWELTKALWKSVGDKTETSARVEDVTQQNGTVRVTYTRAGQSKTVEARRCVIAAPAPLVLPMVKNVPQWKRDALSKVYYGSMTTAGFLLSENSERFLQDGVWRVPVPGKKFISVTNPTFTFPNEVKQRTGQGLLRVYTGDKVSKELRQMSDGEAMEVLSEELMDIFPNIKGKIITGSIKHWDHAIPAWRPGHLEMVEALMAPTGRVHYCGDYTLNSGLESSVLSAHRVLEELEKEPEGQPRVE